jgi:hypothetical protein
VETVRDRTEFVSGTECLGVDALQQMMISQ